VRLGKPDVGWGRRTAAPDPLVPEPLAFPPGRASASPPPHECTWDAVGVELRPCDNTSVLMRCSGCRHVHTELLEGVWTLDQVRGQDMATTET
jgi:hypothetical protein